MLDDDAVPMNYYRALRDIREWMPDDAIIVSEGANTMDIGRTQLPNAMPRKRLDAGTYGTMGVGLGFAIAAAVACPDEPVVAVEGDSGFGFSGMEIETICRLGLPVKTVVLNNGGIGASAGEDPNVEGLLPPGALTRGARYDLMMEAFGGRGVPCRGPGGPSQGAGRRHGLRRPDPRQRRHQPQGGAQAAEVPLALYLSQPMTPPSPAPGDAGERGGVRGRCRPIELPCDFVNDAHLDGHAADSVREVSIATARNALTRLVQEAEGGEVVHITRRGKPVAVLVSTDEFDRLESRDADRDVWDAIDEWRTQASFDWPEMKPKEVDGWRDRRPGREPSRPD